jgi:hypothetical protein
MTRRSEPGRRRCRAMAGRGSGLPAAPRLHAVAAVGVYLLAVRALLAGGLVWLLLAGGASAAVSGAPERSRALVVQHIDVPDDWGSTVANPCPLTQHPVVGIAARSASGWAAPGPNGIWSVAEVASSRRDAQLRFSQLRSELRACVLAHLRKVDPGNRVFAKPLAVPPLADRRTGWTVGYTGPDRFSVHVVLLRTGSAVAWYIYSWPTGLSMIRHALGRTA